MNKEKKLLKNFGLLTVGNATSKVLVFLLIPLYTSILTTYEFGVYELVLTTINLALPIFTLGIADSTLRFSMEKDVDKRGVYSISTMICVLSIVLVGILLIINRYTLSCDFLVGNELFFLLIFGGMAEQGILVAYAKGIDRVYDTTVAGIVGAFSALVLNVLFLVILRLGLRGYFLATSLGIVFQVAYLLYRLRNTHERGIYITHRSLEKEMLKYSFPLVANNVAWWINNALDRYILTYFKGVSENGIYSVGYKIPTILNVIQSLFHQAWTLSAIQEYKTEEAQDYFLGVYRKYNSVLVGICGVLILINKTLAKFLYAKEFYDAWRYVPILCIGFLFLGLSNYVGGIFNALKMPKTIALSTVIGALINIILNLVLIPIMGAMGAAVATCISYIVIWVIRIVVINMYQDICFFSFKEGVSYIALALGTLYTIDDNTVFNTLKILMIMVVIVIYRKELNQFLSKAAHYVIKEK